MNEGHASFQLITPGATLQEDVLGVWEAISPVASFDPGGQEDVPVWRVNLPADWQSANDILARRQKVLDASQHALPVASGRLEAFVTPHSPVSFDLTGSPGQPERELAALLREMRGEQLPESFFPGERLLGWRETAEAFIDQLMRAAAHYAWVETLLEARLAARTVVTWTGSVETSWRAGLGSSQMALHQRSLALALASRTMLLRVFGFAGQGAVKLAVQLSMPGGAILTLPAAWRFINQVLAEYRQYQQLTGELSYGK